MNHYISLPYSNSFSNNKHIEIEQVVKFCIHCDNKILSNMGFFKKVPEDDLLDSTTICGFCYVCSHHVMPSDCYNKMEITWVEDNSIKFNNIYQTNPDINYFTNPMLKN